MRVMRTALALATLATTFGCATRSAPIPSSSARPDFLRLIDRTKVLPDVDVDAWQPHGAVEQCAFRFRSDAKGTVPGIFVRKPGAAGRLPVVICLHGTGGSKTSELPMMRTLAGKGFLAVSIDGRYHGDRAVGATPGMNAYQAAILAAYRGSGEHPFFFDSVWDVMRLVDYLGTRPDVDAARIGIYGVSKGGIEAYLAAAVDPRIKAAVPCIAMESFRYADGNDLWQHRIETIQHAFDAAAKDAGIARPDGEFVHAFYSRVAPGIDGEFDGPAMGPLIAPRALLLINGELDLRTPPAGLKMCTDAISAAYRAEGAEDRFSSLVERGAKHQVTAEGKRAAVEWFVRWLKP